MANAPTVNLNSKHALAREAGDYALGVLGSLLYALSVNLFVLPSGLYIGNLTGIAQILRELAGTIFPGIGDLTGVFLLALNLPLLFISFQSINRKFFYKTILNIVVMSAAMSVIPVRLLIPGLKDTLTICLIGGILAGIGTGLCLRSGGSSGGTDILGVFISLKRGDLSVGRVSLLISLLVYVYALFRYPALVLVYSVIFTLIYTFVVDKVHYQNVKISVMVVTTRREVLTYIVDVVNRSATYWKGQGAFTDQEYYVVNTVVSKYELINLRKGVQDVDPQAFLIENNAVNVTGNFPSHFF